MKCLKLQPPYEEAEPEVNAPILRPQGLASELLENVPGQYEHEEGVESEVSVEITPNSCPF